MNEWSLSRMNILANTSTKHNKYVDKYSMTFQHDKYPDCLPINLLLYVKYILIGYVIVYKCMTLWRDVHVEWLFDYINVWDPGIIFMFNNVLINLSMIFWNNLHAKKSNVLLFLFAHRTEIVILLSKTRNNCKVNIEQFDNALRWVHSIQCKCFTALDKSMEQF